MAKGMCGACGRICDAKDLTDTGVGSDIKKVCDLCLREQDLLSCWRCKALIPQADAREVPTPHSHIQKVCKPCAAQIMGN
jgi:hypothetical protein